MNLPRFRFGRPFPDSALWIVPTVLVCAGLMFRSHLPRKPGAGLMGPTIDLRRVIVPTDVVRIEEQSSQMLELVTDEWILWLTPIERGRVEGQLSSERQMVRRLPGSREEVLQDRGSPVVHRFLYGTKGPSCADSVRYVVSFNNGSGWAFVFGVPRHAGAPFDVTPFDKVLLSLRLAEKPRPEFEVPPAWLAYQSRRANGSAIAKFVVNPEAPLQLGRDKALDRDWSLFSDADFRRGGRQLAPDLVEFYAKPTAPVSLRLDVWLDTQPTDRRESVFDATLDLDDGKLSIQGFDERFHVSMPPGHYNVSITRVNAGEESDLILTHGEYFQRDDLERYEIFLNRRRSD